MAEGVDDGSISSAFIPGGNEAGILKRILGARFSSFTFRWNQNMHYIIGTKVWIVVAWQIVVKVD